MTDVVVTVPKHLWHEWLAEGDLAGEPESGTEYENSWVKLLRHKEATP